MAFSPEFERDVLTAMFRHPSTFADYQDVIQPKTFGVPAYRKLWHITQEFYRDQKELPTATTLVDLILDKETDGFFLAEDMKCLMDNFEPIMNGTPVNEKYVLDKLIAWVREKRLRAQVTTAVRKIESGDAGVSEVIQLVKDAEVPSEIVRQEEEEDFARKMLDHILLKRAQPDANFVRTGLKTLDKILGGGPKRGYKCVIFGPPGHGKTTTAVQICGSAIGEGLGAFYVYNDDTEEEMYDRFIPYFSDIPTKELVEERHEEKLISIQNKLVGSRGKLGLRFIPEGTTPSQVRRMVERRIETGYPVDVLVVDHMRNMRADESTDDGWNDLGKIFRGLMSIAMDHGLVLYAVMHTKRKAEGKPYMDNSFMGLSYEPVKDANLILAVFRARDDFASQGYDESLRVQVTKHRNGPGLGAQIRFNVDFNTMQIKPHGHLVLANNPEDDEAIFDPTED